MGTVVRAGYEGPLWLEGFTVKNAGKSDSSDVLNGYAIAVGGWEEPRGWIVGNIIEDNVMGEGAVLFSSSNVDFNADILVSGNVVRNNSTLGPVTGAIDVYLPGPGADSGRVRIENNVVVDNEHGGIEISQYLYSPSQPESPELDIEIDIVNNTVSNNAYGMVVPVERLRFHNNLVYGNQTDVYRLEEPTDRSVLNNLMVSVVGFVGSDGNISEDPQFVDATAGDYHVSATSPARDAGTSDLATSFDLESRARDALPDIGGYEVP
jgi:hypothetical protein